MFYELCILLQLANALDVETPAIEEMLLGDDRVGNALKKFPFILGGVIRATGSRFRKSHCRPAKL